MAKEQCPDCPEGKTFKNLKQHQRYAHGPESVDKGEIEVVSGAGVFSGLRGELGRIEALHKTNPSKAAKLHALYIKSTRKSALIDKAVKQIRTKDGGNAVWTYIDEEGY